MYRHYKRQPHGVEGAAHRAELFALLLAEPQCLPTEWRQLADAARTAPTTARIVADYIAGMTDRFALDEHARLFDRYATTTMNLFTPFPTTSSVELEALARDGALPAGLDLGRFTVEPPRDPAHGDISTNAAMVLAKPAGMNAARARREADRRAAAAACRESPRSSVAGPGFINLRLADQLLARAPRRDPARRARPTAIRRSGQGVSVNVEYVSANPTGPMHVGHGRGAVVGDVLAALLQKAGYARRARILHQRRRRAGRHAGALAPICATARRWAKTIGAIPEGLYPGDYLKETGRALAARDGARMARACRRPSGCRRCATSPSTR